MLKNTTTGNLEGRETDITKLDVLDYSNNTYNYYFPINLYQVEDLLGKVLTHIEAMNLPSSVEKANKDLLRQSIWRWYDSVQENSLTSSKGCIGAIKLPPRTAEPTSVKVL